MFKLVAFSDLDNTLLQSKNKSPEDLELSPVAKNIQGEHIGFSSSKQIHLMDMLLKANGVIIPVTGRSKEAFERCELEYIHEMSKGELHHNYAVISHGAVVMKNGKLCMEWFSLIKSDVNKYNKPLKSLYLQLSKYADSTAKVNLLSDFGFANCLTIKKNKGANSKTFLSLKELAISKLQSQKLKFKTHENDREFTVLPPYASKKLAVEFLKNKICDPSTLTIGLGDSYTDIDFMGECDFSLIPKVSQINNLLKS